MNRVKVWGIYSAYSILFAAVFAAMLAVLTASVAALPAGLLFAVLGAVMLVFDVSFVLTELSPFIMLFGGLFAACAAVVCGLLAVKAGFGVSRLFLVLRRRCDRLRGWQ